MYKLQSVIGKKQVKSFWSRPFSRYIIVNMIYNSILCYLMSVALFTSFLVHMQKKESKVNITGTARHGVNSVLCLSFLLYMQSVN